MFDSSSFAKGYAIIAMAIVALIVVGIIIRDIRNARMRSDIERNGIHTQAEIVNVEVHTGKISNYTNIKLHYRFEDYNGRNVTGVGNAVIFTSDLAQYQPGNVFGIIYNKDDPSRVVLKIENASLIRRK
jgi:hypothetical protein